jgi:3-isopropylmalate/(R)-2-methylmalate dehydratase large subunit
LGKTYAEKIFSNKSGKNLKAGDIAVCDIDFMMASDTTAPITIDSFKKMNGDKIKNPEKIFFILDHAAPAKNQKIANTHKFIREFANEHGIKTFEVGEGICHQLVIENDLVKEGDLAIGADSHTCTYGAVGALSTGVGSTDLAASMVTGKNWFRVPESIKIIFKGRLRKGVYAKDLILKLVGDIGSNGAAYKSIEFHGEGTESLGLSDRLTIANMVVETGAKNGVFFNSNKNLFPDENAEYQNIIEVDLNKITPMISLPHTVDNVVSIEKVIGKKIHQGFLGSCTNGRIEDLRIASQILKNKRINKNCRFILNPASKDILKKAFEEGIMQTLLDAGATLATPGCGACVGTHNGIPADGENVISSSNRNFLGRMGNNQSNIFLGSPAVVAASLLKGEITDPREVIHED